MALAIVAEGDGACKIAYCRVCLGVFQQNVGRGRKRDYCSNLCRGRQKQPSKDRVCEVCNLAIPHFSKRRKHCSAQCATVALVAYHAGYNRLKTQRPKVYMQCQCCRAAFEKQGDHNKIFCSLKCQKRSSRRINDPIRRTRKRKAKVERVDPLQVFERDGWRCQICHRSTPRRLRGTMHDMAPELDHIVPLSKGGEHSYRNTQCSCRKCNGSKRDSVYGQLPMFA